MKSLPPLRTGVLLFTLFIGAGSGGSAQAALGPTCEVQAARGEARTEAETIQPVDELRPAPRGMAGWAVSSYSFTVQVTGEGITRPVPVEVTINRRLSHDPTAVPPAATDTTTAPVERANSGPTSWAVDSKKP